MRAWCRHPCFLSLRMITPTTYYNLWSHPHAQNHLCFWHCCRHYRCHQEPQLLTLLSPLAVLWTWLITVDSNISGFFAVCGFAGLVDLQVDKVSQIRTKLICLKNYSLKPENTSKWPPSLKLGNARINIGIACSKGCAWRENGPLRRLCLCWAATPAMVASDCDLCRHCTAHELSSGLWDAVLG